MNTQAIKQGKPQPIQNLLVRSSNDSKQSNTPAQVKGIVQALSSKATLKRGAEASRVESVDDIPEAHRQRMYELLLQMSTLYPSFKTQVVDTKEALDAVVLTWFNVFRVNQITPNMAFSALYSIQGEKFYPYPTASDLVKAAEVKPEDLGLPTVDVAFEEAATKSPSSRNWSHPAVYYAGSSTGWHLLRTEQSSKTKPIFKSHYEKLVKLVMRGAEIKPLPEPVGNQIEFKKSRLPKEDCLSFITKAKEAAEL